ncbi:MAG: thiamine pyrophosphate-dependent dehydrogenase E1 component subunit alpha [bacterium]|nr:thiamine pyrophosphate-dependent dehydrogenase E1 component subunit alpha [bacterium]
MYSKHLLKKMYTDMLVIRYAEEILVEPIIKGEVKCPVHLYSGQEAVAVGIGAVLARKDYVFGNHRSHGHYLVHGGTLKGLIAEIYGKETGCAKGRGGSMHVCAPEAGFLGADPIVAGTIALATGAALAASIRKDGRIAVSFFGDGATGEGTFYESLNFASLRKLPIIFVCENNLYATHMPLQDCRAANNIVATGKPFCIPSFREDGNDVLKVYDLAAKAAALCRAGKGPVLLEFMTYRMRGHVGPDDNVQGCRTDIRPAREVAIWKGKDPIEALEKYLLRRKIYRLIELKQTRSSVARTVKEAMEFASDSKYPAPEELGYYVSKK